MRGKNKAGKISRLMALALLALAVPAFSLAPADAAQVAVTVEKLTLGEGFIVEPTLVTLSGSERMASVTTRLLTSRFPGVTAYTNTGTVNYNFYLSQVYDPSRGTLLGEFGQGALSGWMVTLNNYFIKASASNFLMTDRNVMRWQYTKNFGQDIGTNVDTLGASTLPSKDALIWKVAEINAAGNKSDYGSAYTSAMSVLKNLGATASEISSALAVLNNTTPGGGTDTGTTPGGTTPSGDTDTDTGTTPGGSGTDTGTTPGGTTPGGSGTDTGTTPGGTTPGGNTDTGTTPGGTNPGGGTDTGSTLGTATAEIVEIPAITLPPGIDQGSETKAVEVSEMAALGLGSYVTTNEDGAVTMSEAAFASGIEASGIQVDNAKPVTPLPVFSTSATTGGTALVTLKVSLDAYAGEALSSVSVLKMKSDGTIARLRMAESAESLSPGAFVWTDGSGNAIPSSNEAASGRDYYINVAIADGSAYDLDTRPGTIVDPLALAVEAADSGNTGGGSSNSGAESSSGGGGCDSGLGVFGGFALVVLWLATARKRGE